MNKTALGVLVLVILALLARWVSGTMDKASDLVDGTVDMVKDGADIVADGAWDLADWATDMAKEGANAVADVAQDTGELIEEGVDVVADGADAVVDGAADVAKDAGELIEEGVDAVEAEVKDMMDSDEKDNMDEDSEDETVAEDGTFEIDADSSTLLRKWATPLKSHNGDVQITSGEVTVTDGMISGGTFEIDMTTIDTTDLKEDEVDGMDEHLYGEDFFDVEKYPTAMLVITDVSWDTVTADLTIKGQTHPVTFDVDMQGNKAMASFEIDRTVRGIMYSSPSLADAIKDKAINDEIEFDVTLTW